MRFAGNKILLVFVSVLVGASAGGAVESDADVLESNSCAVLKNKRGERRLLTDYMNSQRLDGINFHEYGGDTVGERSQYLPY